MCLALANAKQKSFLVPYAIDAIINEHFATPNANWQRKENIFWFGKSTEKFK